MDFPELSSSRLYLREHVDSDQKAYYDLLSNSQAIRYYGRFPIGSMEEAMREIQTLREKYTASTSIKWAIINKIDNQYIGCVGVKDFVNIHNRGTLSCILSPEYWGHGYGREALTTIIDYCFKKLSLNRLQAFVDPLNNQAMSLFGKLGFTNEAIFREYEYEHMKHIDIVIWGLIKKNKI